jgi:hypothetical protein
MTEHDCCDRLPIVEAERDRLRRLARRFRNIVTDDPTIARVTTRALLIDLYGDTLAELFDPSELDRPSTWAEREAR